MPDDLSVVTAPTGASTTTGACNIARTTAAILSFLITLDEQGLETSPVLSAAQHHAASDRQDCSTAGRTSDPPFPTSQLQHTSWECLHGLTLRALLLIFTIDLVALPSFKAIATVFCGSRRCDHLQRRTSDRLDSCYLA